MEEEFRILGIDFGIKRIGLALSDPLLIFSYPYKTVSNDNSLWDNLKSVIDEKNVKKIILGHPKRSNQSKRDITQKVLEFKQNLRLKFNIEIILWDESYTSEMAKQIIIKSVSKKSKRRDKGLIDQNSAAIILQEYLDGEKEDGIMK